MRTTVVTGMLGSGKTTFISALLQDARERVVVLVNDFGALGIDGEIFTAAGIEALELPSGCVCCTLKPELIATVARVVAEFSPAHLVIEPSGVAAPSAVLEALESAGVGPVTVVGVVDASEFLELQRAEIYGAFFLDQVLNADLLLVNKSDLAGAELSRETAEALEALNPSAIVLRTEQARLDAPLPPPRARGGGARAVATHFRFETLSFGLPAATPVAALGRLLRELAEGRYGRVVRAKGLAAADCGPWRFDLSFGQISSQPFGRPVARGRMVVIGAELDAAGLEQELGRLGGAS